jgi:hypothetical protein
MSSREIAYEEGTIARQDKLPYPFVYYPGHYGTFFAFSETENSPLAFCLCAKEAIENYIEFQIRYSKSYNSDPNRNFILDTRDFPVDIAESLREKGVEQDHTIIDRLNFKKDLCHNCNDVVPKYRYCHDMYGTKFSQNYGWYINKKSFEFGINESVTTGYMAPINEILFNSCPDDILDLLEDGIEAQVKRCHELRSADEDGLTEKEQNELDELVESLQQQNQQIEDLIENEVRQSFGHYKKGNRWTSETILYQLIESSYPEYNLNRHYRPEFLDGLELDVYIRGPKIGIEYQGIQHYEPVEHWGGEEALKERQERDERKRQLCENSDVELVYFDHDEELSEEVVAAKIDPLISQ